MRALRHALFEYVGSIVLIGLLLVPVVVSGHHHVGRPQGPCAACVATHHTPVASTPAVAMPAASPVVVGIDPVALIAPTAWAGRRANERGPPHGLLAEEA